MGTVAAQAGGTAALLSKGGGGLSNYLAAAGCVSSEVGSSRWWWQCSCPAGKGNRASAATSCRVQQNCAGADATACSAGHQCVYNQHKFTQRLSGQLHQQLKVREGRSSTSSTCTVVQASSNARLSCTHACQAESRCQSYEWTCSSWVPNVTLGSRSAVLQVAL